MPRRYVCARPSSPAGRTANSAPPRRTLPADGRFAPFGVERDLPGHDTPLTAGAALVGADRRRRIDRAPASPHDRADARDQLADAERLRQIIVGAALEAEHLVGLAVARGQHQDRRLLVRTLGAHGAAQTDPVETGQHHIQDQQIESGRARPIERLASVTRLVDIESRQLEMQPQQLANRVFVFHDEDAAAGGGRGHPVILARVWRRRRR
jgi:hypothetical protein